LDRYSHRFNTDVAIPSHGGGTLSPFALHICIVAETFAPKIPWCGAFPFSIVAHPQYVGTVLTIWGVFLILRFPHGDWLVLPALETLY